MDPFTHALGGAVAARATRRRGDALGPRQRMGLGLLIGLAPDADYLLQYVTDPQTYLNLHRGWTHSLLLLPLWAALLAAVLRWAGRGRVGWRELFQLAVVVLAVHVAVDAITSYGTEVLAPLSGLKAAFPTTFIIDPWFSGMLLLGLLGSLAWRASRIPATAALAVVVAYVGMQAVLMQRAKAWAEGRVEGRVQALAQPFSPFHWKLVAERPEGYAVAHIDLLAEQAPPPPGPDAGIWARADAVYQPPGQARWRPYPRPEAAEDAAVREAWRLPELAGYRTFVRFPTVYGVQRRDGRTCVRFIDLRFTVGPRENWVHAPFVYGACRADRTAAWRPYRWRDGRAEPLSPPRRPRS